jgi:tetratricopeptide (TPR) repeat protein
MIALAGLLTVLVIAAGTLVYLRIIRPRQQTRPYRQAVALLAEQRHQEALPALTAILGKLPDHLRREARFFIAFASYKTGDNRRAEYDLTALHQEDPADFTTSYLLAHILVEAGRYAEAEPILDRLEQDGQLEVNQTRRLLGMVKLHRGQTELMAGELVAAANLFAVVRRLGDFADKIPPDLRDRHLALGTRALLDKDPAEAHSHFEQLRKTAESSPSDQREDLLAMACIGLALTAWLEALTDQHLAIESLLVEAATMLAPDEPLTRAWDLSEAEPTLADRVDSLDDIDAATSTAAGKISPEIAQVLRDIHFLRGVAVLRAWTELDGNVAHATVEEQLNAALERFGAARSQGDELSDIFLVVGLLLYYLHKPGQRRDRGLELLEKARRLGMREPDSLAILNRRERDDEADLDAVDKYLELLDRYLSDSTVRKEVREALVARLSRFSEFEQWDRQPDLTNTRSVEPTLAEVLIRAEILRSHVEEILATDSVQADIVRIRGISEAIDLYSQELRERARSIENEQVELLALTGNRLMHEH